MSIYVSIIIAVVVAMVVGLGVGYVLRKKTAEREVESLASEGQKIIAEAYKEAELLKKEATIQAKDIIFKAKTEFEQETSERRKEIQSLEKRLLTKEENLERRSDNLDNKEEEHQRREQSLQQREKNMAAKEKEYHALVAKEKEKLESIAGMTSQQAKDTLMDIMVDEAKHESAKRIKQVEDEAKEVAEKKAVNIISQAIQRYAGDYATERTISVVNLPGDEMKGRIIGREGRNIRSIEAATGVDLIIDDTPEAVIISSFDPVRREIASLSLNRLIADGRIHPAHIEEVVDKVKAEVEQSIKEAGEKAIFDLDLHGMHPELIRLVGRLKYRTSYTQNIYEHSIEVAFICGIMAAELKLPMKQARRAGLLHDIGKAVDHEIEGSHAVIGADLARRYGEAPEIVHAIEAHHNDVEVNQVLDVLVQAGDALSGARPGARKEMLDAYIKRLEALENIGNSFKGVDKTFAIQAGREIRVIVNHEKISDEDAVVLSRDIAKEIEKELTYPGQIRVTVVRETRAVDYAK
ncbi:MAG: ribonuclease Y [Deltaproteobacteria bacterium]|nr:ribonuclease Y [Candidatus Anaeroferrophillus wilburensis]MBN2889960.1 ribonuclease Y [Deltaproteobacteria bacterium]